MQSASGTSHPGKENRPSRRPVRWLVGCCLLWLLLAAVAGSPAAHASPQSYAHQRPASLQVVPCQSNCTGDQGNSVPSDPTSGQCSAKSCTDLTVVLQTWTRWLSWILGMLGVLWILAAFYRGLEPRFGHSSEGPARRIALRIFEAGLIFYIAIRIGDITVLLETIIAGHQDESVALSGSAPGLLAPPHGAIAELLGLITALLVQLFLLYVAFRILYQFLTVLEMLLTGRIGQMIAADPGRIRVTALSSLLELIALGVAVVYAPALLIWFFTFLMG